MELRAALPYARLDPITYLPNRQQFIGDFEDGVEPGAELVMMAIDSAKHFGELLRAVGHECADDFIRAGAARIRAIVPTDMPIYHVSLLGFAVIANGNTEALIAAAAEGFAQELICGGIPVVTQLGIGIVACDGPDPATLLRSALAAAQDSRQSNTGWSRYDAKSDTANRRGFLLLTQLNAALAKGEQLRLHYQPKYDVRTGKITGAEALLRWMHPTLGPISPAEFIPLAEKTALIGALSAWVVENAVAQLAVWNTQGYRLNMAINVSPQSFARNSFSAYFHDILARHEVRPETIELEFNEGAAVVADQVLMRELRALRKSGIRVTLDDFGTGFSNLSYITDLPSDTIKIDKQLTQRVGVDERSSILVRSLIELAHAMDCRVVCQGIETAKTNRILAEWGCDEGQGFFVSRALDAEAFGTFMQARTKLQAVVTA